MIKCPGWIEPALFSSILRRGIEEYVNDVLAEHGIISAAYRNHDRDELHVAREDVVQKVMLMWQVVWLKDDPGYCDDNLVDKLILWSAIVDAVNIYVRDVLAPHGLIEPDVVTTLSGEGEDLILKERHKVVERIMNVYEEYWYEHGE